MILVFAILFGVLAGYIRARLSRTAYRPLEVRYIWLVFVSAIPQLLVYFIPATRESISNHWVPFILISTQALLFIFVWLNKRSPMFWLLGLGLLLNFAVISLNGGWMPISPETLEMEGIPANLWQIGSRFGYSKDLVLAKDDTNLWIFSDILTLPKWISYRVAFSIGDVLIAMGVFGFLLHNDEQVVQEKRERKLQENNENDEKFLCSTRI